MMQILYDLCIIYLITIIGIMISVLSYLNKNKIK
jgi:hypothetical protein